MIIIVDEQKEIRSKRLSLKKLLSKVLPYGFSETHQIDSFAPNSINFLQDYYIEFQFCYYEHLWLLKT